jgi:thiol:disulfide interchange protein
MTNIRLLLIAIVATLVLAVACNQTDKNASSDNKASDIAAQPSKDIAQDHTNPQNQPEPHADVQWHTDFDKAMAEAKQTGKLVMVDFNAEWCGPCKMYEKEVFPTAEFKQKAADFILVNIDTDEQADFARKHGVGGIPDIRFFSPDGKEIGKIVGFVGLQGLIAEMDKAKQARG